VMLQQLMLQLLQLRWCCAQSALLLGKIND
jgi:hypothetical protein